MSAVGAMGPLIVGGFTALSTGIKTMDISVIGKGLLGISASGPAFLLFIPAIPGLLLMSTVGAMGKLITEGFKSISTGIKTMDIGVIGKGLIGVTASGPAFLSFIPAIPGLLLMSAVGAMGSLIVGGFTALSIGIKMMDIGVIGKGLFGIAASGPAFVLFIPTIPGLLLMSAVGAIGPLIVGGFTALSTGIKMMDIGVIGKGLLGISALGLSIIPFAFAMTLFSDVNWTGVIAGAAALVIFAAAAFGLGALLAGPGAIIFGVGVIGITALGVAMLPLAMAAKLAGEGMKNFGDGVKDIAANISQIASLEETLSIFKDQELIAGIYSMGFAIAFLNTQLSALGTNLPALAEINKSKNEQSANGEVVAKLDELIGLMQSGAIAVNIDGTKVSTAVGVATKFRGAS